MNLDGTGMLAYKLLHDAYDEWTKSTVPAGTYLYRYEPLDKTNATSLMSRSVFYTSSDYHDQTAAVSINPQLVRFVSQDNSYGSYDDTYRNDDDLPWNSGLWSGSMMADYDDLYGAKTVRRKVAKPEGWLSHDSNAPDTIFNFEAA